MSSLFDDIAQFDEGLLASRREAVAVAHKRVQDRVGSYLKIAKSPEEYDARLDFVSDDIRQIVADVSEEFSIDHEKLAEAIDESLKGEGVTDINGELADAPSAVGEKTAGGHKDGCTCGFCKNKGNLPGQVDQKEQEDKDASEPDDGDGKPDFLDKDSSRQADVVDPSYYMGGDEPPAAPIAHCHNCGGPLDRMATGANCPTCGEPTIDPGFQNSMDQIINPGLGLQASIQVTADAPKDGGGAVKTVDLPSAKGDAVGYGASPEIDKKTWKPNALNADGNLPAVPEGSEMKGTPNPTKQQDLVDEKPDYEGDFLRDTDAVVTQQDLPSADETGHSTERNISQDGQSGTWTESENDAVTPKVFASTDPDVNPLKAILESGFTPDTQVESAIREYESE